jgi:site-specific DNA recombinase
MNSELHSGPRSQLIERSRQLADELGGQAPDELKATLMALLCRVEIRSDRVDIMLSRCWLTELLAGSMDLTMQQASANATDDMLMLTVPVGLRRVGREMRMLVENADNQTPADPSLLRIMAARPRCPCRKSNPSILMV